MKANFLSVTIVAACMVMVSCNNDDTAIPANDGAVRFTSGITATPDTRVAIAGEGNSLWEADDPVGIYMVGHNTFQPAEGNANVKYTASQAGASTAFTASAAAIFYPQDETTAVDFIAYHPYTAAVTELTYPVALSQQTPQTAIDLMTAQADNNGSGYTKADGRNNIVVNFAFSHRLVKLVMNITKDASVTGNITAVSINGMNTTALFDLTSATDGFSEAGAPAGITPFTATAGTKYEAILLPVAALADAHTVTFTTDGGDVYTWAMKKEIASLEAGKIYTYTVNVTRYGVSATGSINKWVVGSTGTGTAE